MSQCFDKALSALILLSQPALPVYGGTSITSPLKIGMPLSLLGYVNFPFSHCDFIPVQELVRTGLVIRRLSSFDFELWGEDTFAERCETKQKVFRPRKQRLAAAAAAVWVNSHRQLLTLNPGFLTMGHKPKTPGWTHIICIKLP